MPVDKTAEWAASQKALEILNEQGANPPKTAEENIKNIDAVLETYNKEEKL